MVTQQQLREHAEREYTARGTPQGPPWQQLSDRVQALWVEMAEKDLEVVVRELHAG